ncbi:MAG: phenylalanine--tRNA ligase subunit alpha, partial [Ruminococcaceae bacterium]|nr:phenylalanine--tRNA ligase subunit alpha [Oscillospiraceae bacterium]
MKETLNSISIAAKEAIATAADEAQIEEIRVKYLGKKGELTAILKQM